MALILRIYPQARKQKMENLNTVKFLGKKLASDITIYSLVVSHDSITRPSVSVGNVFYGEFWRKHSENTQSEVQLI